MRMIIEDLLTRLFIRGRNSSPPGVVEEKNVEEIARLLEEGQNLVLVSSYPRSGNTWLRYLIADIVLQAGGVETETELTVHPDRIVPDLCCNPLSERHREDTSLAVFVKTHETFGQANRKLRLRGRKRAEIKHVYLFRAPEDALVSFYHFHLRYPRLESMARDGIDSFCLSRVNAWRSHVDSYVKAAQGSASVFLLSYESMLQNPVSHLRCLLDWLGFPVAGNMAERAVDNMRFSNLRAREAGNPCNEKNFFFRKGTKGSGEAELELATLEAIRGQTADVYEKAAGLAAEMLKLPRQGR